MREEGRGEMGNWHCLSWQLIELIVWISLLLLGTDNERQLNFCSKLWQLFCLPARKANNLQPCNKQCATSTRQRILLIMSRAEQRNLCNNGCSSSAHICIEQRSEICHVYSWNSLWGSCACARLRLKRHWFPPADSTAQTDRTNVSRARPQHTTTGAGLKRGSGGERGLLIWRLATGGLGAGNLFNCGSLLGVD